MGEALRNEGIGLHGAERITQVAGDLESNLKEQERIGAEIAALQQHLAALQRDHSVLVTIQRALGSGSFSTPAAETRRRRSGRRRGGGWSRGTRLSSPRWWRWRPRWWIRPCGCW
jgi:hypothetical protein